MHQQAHDWVRHIVDGSGPGSRVLEIGSRDVNGSVRDLFPGTVYCGIDLLAGPGVDAAADGGTYRPAVAPDRVVCCEVLEHTPHARTIVANAWYVLAPGGWLIVTAAGPGRLPHGAWDGGALRPEEFYANVEPADLEAWLRQAAAILAEPIADFKVEYRPAQGDLYLAARKARAGEVVGS